MTEKAPNIPGNKHALGELGQVLASGRAIAFVGAGASAGLYPLWGALLEKLADAALERDRVIPEDHQYWLSRAKTNPQQVVYQIKMALGDSLYAQLLRDIFRRKSGADGNDFTPAQGAIVNLPFCGHVTTNYDPGLLNARMAMRPDTRATGYTTWMDKESIRLWLNGEIFNEQPCPILFAHGIYERSSTIILGTNDYRRAYSDSLWRRLFGKLWGEERLVLIGFGFSDPWLDFIIGNVLTDIYSQTKPTLRHFAFLGLQHDQAYSQFMRDHFRDNYGVNAIFYHIHPTKDGGEDHSELIQLLKSLKSSGTHRADFESQVNRSVASEPSPPQLWVHETTEGEVYVERPKTISLLNRWVDDPSVRAIAITGLGGLGKTSLIGHWLKRAGGLERRPYGGLFFWSFYASRDTLTFIQNLLDFAHHRLAWCSDSSLSSVQQAMVLIRHVPLLLVLDGLEVLQEGPGPAKYGALLADELRALLDEACRARHGLTLLTSRFPFWDLTRYLGSSLRALDLDQLTPAEGSELLRLCEVGGDDSDRAYVSQRLEGHPLGLRIFANVLAYERNRNPIRRIRSFFAEIKLRENIPLERKLRRLLTFYEQRLPPARSAILGIVSLFNYPVDEGTILRLARGLPSLREALDGLSDADLQIQLRMLCRDHLLFHESETLVERYSCHPVLHEHFRRYLLGRAQEAPSKVVDLLNEKPSTLQPINFLEIEPVVAAIELLIEAGDFHQADRLYTHRLAQGQHFQALVLPQEGFRCTSLFVLNQKRQDSCAESLSNRDLAFYLNEAACFAVNAGDFSEADSLHRTLIVLTTKMEDDLLTMVNLQNYSHLLVKLGNLEQAQANLQKTLEMARRGNDRDRIRNSHAGLGEILGLRGSIHAALHAFDEANRLEARRLYSHRGVAWAELLLRIGQAHLASTITWENLSICERQRWMRDVGRCLWMLGSIQLVKGQLPAAARDLEAAEAIFRPGHQLYDLNKVLLARADLERRRGEGETALQTLDEILRVAAPKEMRLVQADALVLRGRISLERIQAESNPGETRLQIESAADDADAALALARQCGYAWAERDALHLLTDAVSLLGDTERALSARRDADALFAKLRVEV